MIQNQQSECQKKTKKNTHKKTQNIYVKLLSDLLTRSTINNKERNHKMKCTNYWYLKSECLLFDCLQRWREREGVRQGRREQKEGD